jgi:hypothetical protein
LKSKYNEEDADNTVCLAINRLYNIDETEHVVTNVIQKIKDFSVRGICFYPEKSGTKLIFLFSNETKNETINTNITVQHKQPIRHIQQNISTNNVMQNNLPINNNVSQSNKLSHTLETNIKKPIKTLYIPKQNIKSENYVFEMKKTDSVDVYILNIVESTKKMIKLDYNEKE